MMNYRGQVVFRDTLLADDVYWQEVASTRKKDPEIEKLARREWQRIVRECQKEKKKIWNSQLYRFENFQKINGKAHFWASTIPFSLRIGMRKFSARIGQKGIAYAPLGMFVSCLVLSRDREYLFIEKSAHYFATRQFSLIGGVLSKSEGDIKEGEDLFRKIKDEVIEEVGCSPKDIESIALKAGYITESLNFALLASVQLKKTLNQLTAIFAKRNTPESKELIGVQRANLPKFVRTQLPKRDWPKFQILGVF